ncbi:hypothetical protein RvY_17658 [Ramazzottius varieornatus]|uniref:Uncharacterized protein n=1 Tax=Ramazzottius varieornatus TaxID=947166 RepID=A0A1D1W3N0_RAMVA|nr:hypothetical protein RvY_17658 [Ramazzottius varieornatus]
MTFPVCIINFHSRALEGSYFLVRSDSTPIEHIERWVSAPLLSGAIANVTVNQSAIDSSVVVLCFAGKVCPSIFDPH